MKEKRIYVVGVYNLDGDPYMLDLETIIELSDDDFIEEAEAQGWVWSSMESYAESYNGNYELMPDRDNSIMRIIEVKHLK